MGRWPCGGRVYLDDSRPLRALRRRCQDFVDRRFYRRKYDAANTLEAFGAMLSQKTDIRTVHQDLMTVIGETMRPTYVSLVVAPGSRSEGEGRLQ
jgi:hypothetical protein